MIKLMKRKNGFTLVELMVAIAVFSIVMVTAMSALLNVIDANNKARAIKSAINNVSMALESISKEMRMGSKYKCSINGGQTFNDECPDGGDAIKFVSPFSDDGGCSYYKFDEANKTLLACEQSGVSEGCEDLNTPYSPITADDVDITGKFYVINNTAGNQPKMILTLTGKAGSKDDTRTEFSLQTTVSQRTRKE
jgi:prepilin-type N-terminal cleavage/methylation domain-containing protein